ncbi:hypothetical protein [Robertmurraya siralis]|uniref:hypothetical protein n=1 Tax=Robertmurraya siralis TaxID=77777 RepID=UPI0010F80653|nr:hypothetical protein [Robertmurraya siralis]
MSNLNLKNTYFGFTSNKKPLQTGKIEKSLDQLIRYDGKVITKKEYIYLLLQKGCAPDIEENYTYYSIRTGDYTKPKTLYKLTYEDGSYHEINKTLYSYAQYILDNNFLNESVALNHIQTELEAIEAAKQKEFAEREERLKKHQLEEQKRKEEREKKRKQWKEIGLSLMTDNIKNAITESISDHWELIQSHGYNDKEALTVNTIELFTEQLGNTEYIKGNVSYVFHEGKEYKNLNNALYRSIYTRIFNATELDSKQTLTAKVKAFYEGREYKGGNYQPKEQETFYFLNAQTKQFESRQGERMSIKGLTCFIAKNNKGLYAITEARTGMLLGSPKATRKEAIEVTKNGIERVGERLEQLIQNNIEKYGISPLYEEETSV